LGWPWRKKDEKAPACPDDGGLRGLACRYGREAREQRAEAVKYGQRHRKAHFAVGISAVIAGVIAGIAGLAEDAPLLTGIAGFGASALAGIGTKLDAERLARFHFSQAADYGQVARLFETLATGTAEPTRDELDRLVSRFAQVQGRSLDDPRLTPSAIGQGNLEH